MTSPPKKKGGLCRTALPNVELTGAYRLLTFLQAPCGFLFWVIEQRKARLQDQIGNQRRDR
jgi:hypothetical protein